MRKRFLLGAALVLAPAMQPAEAVSIRAAVKAKAYIVLFDSSVKDPAREASAQAAELDGQVERVYQGRVGGFVGRFKDGDLAALKRRAGVSVVAADGPVTVATVQTSAPGNLDRIDQVSRPLNGEYGYTMTGAGVTAYVIDTGIRTSHSEFAGRASVGFDAYGGTGQDCNGHGTHVAGTVGGTTYGVAKAVKLVGVRVLDCSGYGRWSDVIAGVNWVTNNALKPAVANMSLTGGTNSAVDAAVRASIKSGVSYAIAAGNSNRDACKSSPSRVKEAMVTAATDANDKRASFSNYGSCVDWFAPGVSIRSAGKSSDTATAVLSGTSMASPHSAGVAALYLQATPAALPATVSSALAALTIKEIVSSSRTSNDNLLFTNF